MNKHEQKYCPRCSTVFECKPGSINQCQCSGIQLTVEERVYIESKYEDCLCINCLKALQQEYFIFKKKHIFK
ncbi:MAG: cysteine-rich CWC family protein [Ferruginibacter sp.]